MRLKTKIMAAFSLISAIAFIVGGIGYWGTKTTVENMELISRNNLPSIQALLTLKEAQATITAAERTVVNATSTSSLRSKEYEVIKQAWLRAEAAMKAFETLQDSQDKEMWQPFKLAWEKWKKSHESAIAMSKEFDQLGIADVEKADELMHKLNTQALIINNPLLGNSALLLDELIKDKLEDVENNEKNSNSQATWAIKLLTVSAFLGLALALTIGLLLTQRITQPVVELVTAAKLAAGGNLTTDIKINSKDEIGTLGEAFKLMIRDLRDVVIKVVAAGDNLNNTSQELTATSQQSALASEQVAQTVGQLAAGASEQAKSVEETSILINQISTTSQQVASNAQAVSHSSVKASEAANDGLNQSINAVSKMEQICIVSSQAAESVNTLGELSTQIGQIIDVIKGIADQTNLLALNAAIEAARAGEQGRGFAVVADEVRKLAEQSSVSAGQIATLIDNIQNETKRAVVFMEQGSAEIAEGVEAVSAAGAAFDTIASEITQVVAQIQEVSAAAQQMATSSGEAAQSILNIAAVAEQTAASAQEVSATTQEQTSSMEEVATAAQSLSQLAIELEGHLVKFKL